MMKEAPPSPLRGASPVGGGSKGDGFPPRTRGNDELLFPFLRLRGKAGMGVSFHANRLFLDSVPNRFPANTGRVGAQK
jgi:hypothetical protein